MVHQRLQLAFLSPKITQAILAGEQPDGLTQTRFVKSDIPLDWHEQWTLFGFDEVA